MLPLMPETKMYELPKPFAASTCGAQSGIAAGVFDVKVFFVVVGAACAVPANSVPASITVVMIAIPTLSRFGACDGSRPAQNGALVLPTCPPTPANPRPPRLVPSPASGRYQVARLRAGGVIPMMGHRPRQ